MGERFPLCENAQGCRQIQSHVFSGLFHYAAFPLPLPPCPPHRLLSQGREIQATFWRAQADRYFDVIQENKVFVFSKFQVKVANKAYNTCKNDYEIHFGDK